MKKEVHYWCDDTLNQKIAGQKVTIAVLDTGLAPHPDFRGRVAAFKDCIRGRDIAYDDSGHGTHVAGIAAGSGKMSKGILAGMAPEARLVIVKILNEKGEGDMGQILEGLHWVYENWERFGVRIVNISVGAKNGMDQAKGAMLIEEVEKLWDAGLVVIVSAGNFGPEAGTVAIPGTSRKVITVGAVAGNGKGIGCSGLGPTEACVVKPEVMAPGYQIISCNNISNIRQKPYTVKSGTSMATPVVSGAAALLLSKYPDMSNVEMKLRFRSACMPFPGAKECGWGSLRVDRLLAGNYCESPVTQV